MKTSIKKTINIYLNTNFLCIFEVIFNIYSNTHAIASEAAIFRHHERLDSFAYPLQRHARSE